MTMNETEYNCYLEIEGLKIAKILKLKKSKYHKGFYQTNWGDKSCIGVANTILVMSTMLEGGMKICE